MSNKLKVAVFSVSFWENEKHDHYYDWRKGIENNINYDYIFTCPGSYSDPEIMENELEVIQIDIKNTEDYGRDWNYWRVGFNTALYHLLLNIRDFDVAIHVQDSILLNLDLNPFIEEFNNRDEIIAAPQYISEGGMMIETSLMMLKKEAIQRYVTSPLRPALSKEEVLNVEEEAFSLFKDEWWNFIPHIPTIRKNDFIVFEHSENYQSPFTLDEETFLKLPLISTSKSYTLDEHINKWKEYNNI